MPTLPDFGNFHNIRTSRITSSSLVPTMRSPSVFIDGVMEGGGTLGAAYIGSLTFLEEAGIWFKRIAGNSAGAITAALIAAGYKAAEIEWLMSNFSNPRISRPATLPSGLQPVDFMKFLDFPLLSTVRASSKQKTLLWNVLKGQAIDTILDAQLPLPTRKKTIDDIVTGLKSVPVIGGGIGLAERQVRLVLDGILGFVPDKQSNLRFYRVFNTQRLREQFADTVWDAVARVNPQLLIGTQLLFEGSLFEGKVFFDTMEKLLRAKRQQTQPGAQGPVTFSQLSIPLAVIACNYDRGEIEIYSSVRYPSMSVSEAVRRSMSLPLVFQPRGGAGSETIIDGGVGSNFPVWLYTPAGDIYWPPNSIDPARPKIGFSLDETKPVPTNWRVGLAKFRLSGNQTKVPFIPILMAILVAKLIDEKLFTPTANFSIHQLKADLGDWKLLEVLFGWLSVDKELAARKQIVRGFMNSLPYFDVEIPLQGFHGFDFSINSDRSDIQAIAGRGYMAALDSLSAAPLSGNPLITNPTGFQNPY